MATKIEGRTFLTDRREIAQAINIERLPVITMDITKPIGGDEFYKGCYEGSKVVLAIPYPRYPDNEEWCKVKMFGDYEENKEWHDKPWMYGRISLQEKPVGIHSSFGLWDVREMVAFNNAVHVKNGDKVVVFFDGGDNGHLRLMKIKGHTLVDVEEV